VRINAKKIQDEFIYPKDVTDPTTCHCESFVVLYIKRLVSSGKEGRHLLSDFVRSSSKIAHKHKFVYEKIGFN
jgi:hypothetical protein